MEYLLASLLIANVIVPLIESGQFAQAVKFALALGKEHWHDFIDRYNEIIKKQKYKNIKVGDVILHVTKFERNKDKSPVDGHVKWLFVTKITKRFMSYQVIQSDTYGTKINNSEGMLYTRPILAVTSLYKKHNKIPCTPEEISNGEFTIVKESSLPAIWTLRKIPSSEYKTFHAIQVQMFRHSYA